MNSDQSFTPSPCIGKCGLDAQDVCRGCFRTMDEILRWENMSEADKQSTVVNCKTRRQMRAHVHRRA
ncbi:MULTISPECIES: DUF1289 domain-containing protein [unclassified Methylophaga]|uniref:DUF1289 domain-containing protein n=1 Tax=unclassified Methylophaga TaxID=2629249 RepID=UPI000C8D065B|nr:MULTISPECIES: DUF1289 domain-containing protein [unclassified Methylophaga]MAK67879.1 DUF1289 domain-containing protein [Methylophaga sp.]MAY18561.1 DUF1289 domain-containing protein [Methylophaga sp.]MBN45811.1 DUF1289 domain-containing protein [Methylophaga sp.]HAO25688.1 DUF1289 domain-containing protein [Methylophaga sp.]HCD05590.1 DUF1289 domain-containing protein [Methylophaga sp.]